MMSPEKVRLCTRLIVLGLTGGWHPLTDRLRGDKPVLSPKKVRLCTRLALTTAC
jgi:hypothetical protein